MGAKAVHLVETLMKFSPSKTSDVNNISIPLLCNMLFFLFLIAMLKGFSIPNCYAKIM